VEGWIKLHRRFLKWEWFEDEKMVKLFIYLLLSVNFEDKKWRGIDVKRGQMITGRKILSKETGMSEQSIRTCLERLKSTNEITIKATNQYSVLTLTNYESYQEGLSEVNQQTNQPLTNEQPTSNQRATTTKEVKKEKKVRSIFRKPTIEQISTYCKKRNNNIDPQYFFDKNEANGWVSGKNQNPIKDWEALVRTWERFSKKESGDGSSINIEKTLFKAND
jgi:hypothetical protein